MSKIREVEQAIRELRDAASLLNDTANWLYELFSADKVQEHNTDSVETQKQLTLGFRVYIVDSVEQIGEIIDEIQST